MRAAAMLVALLLVAPVDAASPPRTAMIILGVDGMDPDLLRGYMEEGILPNLSGLAAAGGFAPLGTSVPPQSPVAWSDFITGMDAGGHGLFDFLALDRETLLPMLSTSRVEAPSRAPLAIGSWRLPLAAERVRLLRDGDAFWQILAAAGVSTTVFQMPANYPPVEAAGGESLSGMGTPDLRGTPGLFSYFTDDPHAYASDVSGGEIVRVTVRGGTVESRLHGPPNAFREGRPAVSVPLTVRVDAEHPVAMVAIGDERVLLAAGEWSRWVRVRFPLVPGHTGVPGMVRFYLRSAPEPFVLYASPVNIDPREPAQPISAPGGYAPELARAAGPFYTQEMPEDTKALSAGVLAPLEFLAQSGLVLDERRALLRHELARLRERERPALLFFYLSSIDQRHHMLQRHIDRDHPLHDPDTPRALADALRDGYREVDELVGWIADAADADTSVVVMSDHGFASFRRQVHLNAWLERNGYLALRDPVHRDAVRWLDGVDWSRTRAFALGLNSLYLNVRGRERDGIVDPANREPLAREISARLAAWRDPDAGELVVTWPALRESVYHGPHVERAPDIIVGYARGYRASWATTAGEVPVSLIEDNRDEWSGDHCMDARAVPGVLLADRPLRGPAGNLRDLTVSVLAYFGISAPPQMRGWRLF